MILHCDDGIRHVEAVLEEPTLIMKSHVFCDFVLTVHVFFTELFFDYDQSGRRGHLKKLFTRRSRLDIRKFAFSNRIVDRWNSLSICCVTCNSINCFMLFPVPVYSKYEI